MTLFVCIVVGCKGHKEPIEAVLHCLHALDTRISNVEDDLGGIKRTLRTVITKEGTIMAQQDDVNAAATGIEDEVADLTVQDAAIAAVTQQILALQQAGVDTTALVAATADLLTAHGADDAAVAALTAAANPAPPAPDAGE